MKNAFSIAILGVEQSSVTSPERTVSSADLDACAHALMKARVLIDCLRNHHLRDGYLSSADTLVLDCLPAATEFLRAFSFDVDEYLASTPFSHSWLREHGHGD